MMSRTFVTSSSSLFLEVSTPPVTEILSHFYDYKQTLSSALARLTLNLNCELSCLFSQIICTFFSVLSLTKYVLSAREKGIINVHKFSKAKKVCCSLLSRDCKTKLNSGNVQLTSSLSVLIIFALREDYVFW